MFVLSFSRVIIFRKNQLNSKRLKKGEGGIDEPFVRIFLIFVYEVDGSLGLFSVKKWFSGKSGYLEKLFKYQNFAKCVFF